MKKTTFKTILVLLATALFISSCKVKKQLVADEKSTTQLAMQFSANRKVTTNLSQDLKDSSRTIKKDSTLISVTEKDDIEYDYTNPILGTPSKVIHHIEKTVSFSNGSNVTSQKHINSLTTANLDNIEKKAGLKTTKSNDFRHTVSNIVSSSTSWIWALIALIIIVIAAIHLVRKFNLINIFRSAVTKLI